MRANVEIAEKPLIGLTVGILRTGNILYKPAPLLNPVFKRPAGGREGGGAIDYGSCALMLTLPGL